MIDWPRVRDLAALGFYASDIARAIGYDGDVSNFKVSAYRRGIRIMSMTTSERARRAGRIGGRKPKKKAPKTAPAVSPPAPDNVLVAIRELLEAA